MAHVGPLVSAYQWCQANVSRGLRTTCCDAGGFIAHLASFVAVASTTPGLCGKGRFMSRPAPHETEVDRVASMMAAGAGLAWDRLDTYPGYLRGYWRSEARLLLGRLAAGDTPGRA